MDKNKVSIKNKKLINKILAAILTILLFAFVIGISYIISSNNIRPEIIREICIYTIFLLAAFALYFVIYMAIDSIRG